MKAEEITLEMLKNEYQKASAETFSDYIMLVSAYMYDRLSVANPLKDKEYHSLVAAYNDYIFDESRMDKGKLLDIQGVHVSNIKGELMNCGMTEDEAKMVLAVVQEQAFINYMVHGKDSAKMYEVLHFSHPHTLIVLKWYTGLFTVEWH